MRNGRASVAADGSGAALVLQPTLRVDESGNYALSFSVTDASTGASVWNGSLGMAPAPAQAVAAPAQGGVAGLPPGPPPSPEFVGGAAKTWDEWFDRGIESVGYHPPGSPEEDVRPARNRGTPQDRGFLGRSSIRFGGAVDFNSVHDFHHCHSGRGGNGFASGTIDLRINFADFSDSLQSLDFVTHAWYGKQLDDPYAKVGTIDDIEHFGTDLRLQWSLAPGEWVNPYLGIGAEISKTAIDFKIPYDRTEVVETWVPGHYERYPYYSYYGYTYYSTRYVPGYYKYSTIRRKGVKEFSETFTDVCWLFEAGLEVNLGSRFSLRGDFTYFRKSTKDDGYWADFSRRLLSGEANLRITEKCFLSVIGSYETKDKIRSVNVGLGLFF